MCAGPQGGSQGGAMRDILIGDISCGARVLGLTPRGDPFTIFFFWIPACFIVGRLAGGNSGKKIISPPLGLREKNPSGGGD
jgi:hypothetical protein